MGGDKEIRQLQGLKMSVSEDTVSPAQALEQQTLEIGEGNSNSEVETEDSSSRLSKFLV